MCEVEVVSADLAKAMGGGPHSWALVVSSVIGWLCLIHGQLGWQWRNAVLNYVYLPGRALECCRASSS